MNFQFRPPSDAPPDSRDDFQELTPSKEEQID